VEEINANKLTAIDFPEVNFLQKIYANVTENRQANDRRHRREKFRFLTLISLFYLLTKNFAI
jgi:hypothetical protein